MNKIFSIFLFCFIIQPVFALDDFLINYIDKENAIKPDTNLEYNYLNIKKIPITLYIKEKITTRDKTLFEGKKLYFISDSTVYDKGKRILKKNDTVEGELKLITASGMNGIPYSLVLSGFKIDGINENKLKDEFYKQGQDRGYIVFPLKWALTFLPPTGSLTNFIKGGHCRITPKDKIVIYYYPNWGDKN